MKYRTIVADPPWPYKNFGTVPDRPFPGKRTEGGDVSGTFVTRPIPYQTLHVEEIAELPVRDLAERDAHLYLWTTQRHIFDAKEIVESWGFKASSVLVWCKPPSGVHGGTFVANVEFVVFARRGSCPAKRRVYGQWYEWNRGAHSQKPEAFLDLVESVSPGPYLEMFARRQRLGWDTWGNQALEHVAIGRPIVPPTMHEGEA